MAEQDKSIGTITSLLVDARAGTEGANDQLFSLIYDDLRKIAQRQLGGRGDRLIQATDLVNAACLRVLGRVVLNAEDRRHFFSLFNRAMHDVFVENIRAEQAVKRGGGRQRVPLLELTAGDASVRVEVMDLSDALDELGENDPEGAQIVVLRFLGGRTLAESAEIMGCTFAIARRHWEYARSWLHERLTR